MTMITMMMMTMMCLGWARQQQSRDHDLNPKRTVSIAYQPLNYRAPYQAPPDSWTYLHLFVHSVIHTNICALVYIPATKLYSAISSTTCVQCFLHIFVLFIISAFQLQRINIFPCANICWLLFRPGICIWTLPKSLDICWRFVRKRVSLG